MSYFEETFSIKTKSKTDTEWTICSHDYRFSVITSKLIRVEKGKNFVDEATQSILNRNFEKPKFEAEVDGDIVKISTEDCIFTYNTSRGKMIRVAFKGGRVVMEFDSGNLKGTRRTLDGTFREVPLKNGLMSRDGVSVISDKHSLIVEQNGRVSPRPSIIKDDYYFAYGNDYRGCLKDFYKLTGEVPLIPRYCLGNWWSRYKAYTQEEYISLMKRFIDEKIPVTIATIDMDWHWVDIVERFGKGAKYQRPTLLPKTIYEVVNSQGWTGYSWNTELFPDYKQLLNWLHENKFKVTLNLHPAQGVRFFEDQYEEMAWTMGVDPASKKQIDFDLSDPKFVEAYFNILHKPFEDDGVNFWWIDWQQGKKSAAKNFDPLWALNHYHTMANGNEETRPLILSRYAGVGSHRYPVGFSGDTAINWANLDFQPYFTATATNIGYTWWSHDIGGHMNGSKDDELYLRWVQFGAFSPINRLHSSNNEFMGKEPWKHNYQAQNIATEFLRLRHKFIPYIYSMNYQTHKNARALCEPMYYEYPNKNPAYEVKNQYFFGSELICAPITHKINSTTNLGYADVWLPRGRWTDVFTGAIYEGDQRLKMFRGIENFPLLAKEGAIIPLSKNDTDNDSANPEHMIIKIYRGNNSFELYEDDGESNAFQDGKFAITKFEVSEKGSNLTFKIAKVEGDCDSTVAKRTYELHFEDIISVAGQSNISHHIDNIQTLTNLFGSKVVIILKDVLPTDEIVVELNDVKVKENIDIKAELVELISKYQMSSSKKASIFNDFIKNPSIESIPIKQSNLRLPIVEVLSKKN
ncbi:MAG: glycoside hydrolase family 31 protein [Clostridia bacterium]